MTTTTDRTSALADDVVLPAARLGDCGPGVEVDRLPDEIVVAVRGEPHRRIPAVLSCRLHEAVATARRGDALTVDLGGVSVTDPAVERVLRCARASATARGLEFRIR